MLVCCEPAENSAVGEELGDVSTRHGQMQVVDTIGLVDRFDLSLERRQFSLHAGNLLARWGGRAGTSPFPCSDKLAPGVAARNARTNMIE